MGGGSELGAPGWLLAGFAALTVGLLGWLGWSWRRRRAAVRVDNLGAHELFADGRELTHLWEDLEETTQPGQERMFTFRSGSRRLRLGPCLADGWSLARVIRARLRGESLEPAPERWQPTAEQVAEWLEVKPEKLPLRFTYGPGRNTALLLGWLVSFELTGLLIEKMAQRVLTDSLWGQLLGGLGGLSLSAVLTIPLFFRAFRRWGETIVAKVGVYGIEVAGDYCTILTWEDLQNVSDNEFHTRQGTFYLPAHPRDANRLRRALQRALKARGPVPEATLLPSQVPTAAALSQASRSPGDAVSERSLSQAGLPEEAKSRLSGEVTEEEEVVHPVSE